MKGWNRRILFGQCLTLKEFNGFFCLKLPSSAGAYQCGQSANNTVSQENPMKAIVILTSSLFLGVSHAEEIIRPPIGDPGLRAFLNLSSIFSQTKPPEGTLFYICTFAKFENGEFKGYGGHLDSTLADRPFFAELIWGPVGDSTGWAIATVSAQSGGHTIDPFFKNIKTSGWRAYELRKEGSIDEPILYNGYRVLDIATDGRSHPLPLPEKDLQDYLKRSKYAVVFLVKFFENQENYLKTLKDLKMAEKKG